ncbi:MAG: hypothetical protein IKW91_06975 [Bacteroidaceae bacterium]|nr:hypothetical protein [Bacteroidaceae bacterium]
MKKIILYLFALVVSLNVKSQVTDYQNWMAQLDDNAFICQLSIPGAHDACCSSFSGGSAFGALFAGKVQSKSVQEMLPLGVRGFDLRPAVKNNKLTICHGILVTSFDFNTIMQQLCAYVDAHPSEFCVVTIRHEVEADDSDTNFASMLQTSLASIKDHLVDFRPNLTVGEARGKILFISRDAYDEPMYGGRLVDLRDNQSDINNMLGGHCYGPSSYKCSWWVQGYYEYSDVNDKKNAILAMLTKSSELAGKYNYTWVDNGAAGYKGTGTNAACQANAEACNPYLQGLLSSGNYNGPVGFVFMDFCCDGDNSGYYGLSLTKELINHNFRYTMSKQGDPIYDESGNLFVAPKGCDMMWEGKFFRKESTTQSGPTGWFREDFDDSGWETKRFPTASEGTNAPYYSLWDGTNNSIFIRREFYVDHDPSIDTYKFYVRHDDDYVVYLNGRKLDSQEGWIGDYRIVSILSSRLNVGRNVLAVQVKQFTGGAYFDCGVLCIEATKASLKLTSDKWHTFVALGHNVDFTGTNVEAYKITGIEGERIAYAIKEEVSIVPAGEAVIVRSDNGAGTYQIPVTKTSATLTDNMLKATTASFDVAQANTIYCLAEQNGFQGFYPQDVGTSLAKNKVYLNLSEYSERPDCILLNPDDVTSIVSPLGETEEGAPIYNLAGQRLNKFQKGINIVGGQKLLVE